MSEPNDPANQVAEAMKALFASQGVSNTEDLLAQQQAHALEIRHDTLATGTPGEIITQLLKIRAHKRPPQQSLQLIKTAAKHRELLPATVTMKKSGPHLIVRFANDYNEGIDTLHIVVRNEDKSLLGIIQRYEVPKQTDHEKVAGNWKLVYHPLMDLEHDSEQNQALCAELTSRLAH